MSGSLVIVSSWCALVSWLIMLVISCWNVCVRCLSGDGRVEGGAKQLELDVYLMLVHSALIVIFSAHLFYPFLPHTDLTGSILCVFFFLSTLFYQVLSSVLFMCLWRVCIILSALFLTAFEKSYTKSLLSLLLTPTHYLEHWIHH